MKYLIYKELGAVLFDDRFKHSQVAYDLNDIAYGQGNEVVAGGDVKIHQPEEGEQGIIVEVSGEAEGISGVLNRGNEDAEIIRKMITQ